MVTVHSSCGAARLQSLLLVSCASLLVGCAGQGGATGQAASGGGVSPRRSANVVTGDEVRDTPASNLYDALARLRPQWLRSRGRSSLTQPGSTTPVVFVAGVEYGPLSSLREMYVDQVRRVEFINARDATTRFGTGHAGGVIMVDLDRN